MSEIQVNIEIVRTSLVPSANEHDYPPSKLKHKNCFAHCHILLGRKHAKMNSLSLFHKSYKIISYIIYSVCYVCICVHLVAHAHRGWKSTSIVFHPDF